ncbi:MAG TPA: ATP-binding cassette domain-containing protein [Egibacteraceae bacterium]|nr:ATP-binding cassette domain-containing protein [Egibacteraceae bacterium]
MTVAAGIDRSASADDVVVTEGLTKVYRDRHAGSVRAVDALNLRVRRGETLGLLGPNGAGKTTTLGMLTTRVVPTAGRVLVAGVDVVAHPARARQRIGVVPQTNTLDRSLTVAENLYYHGRYFGMGRNEATWRSGELLERFHLTNRGGSAVDALSGGMAQRLMVARALMHHPAVLFLDEPTTGLDPQSRMALWDLLGALHAEGQTILLTTHYMQEAERLADRVAIMDHGRILALDSPAELSRSAGARTVVVLSAEGDLEVLAQRLGELPAVSRTEVHDGVVRALADRVSGLLPQLLAQAEAAGFSVSDLSVTDPTLEAAFIALTGKDLRE